MCVCLCVTMCVCVLGCISVHVCVDVHICMGTHTPYIRVYSWCMTTKTTQHTQMVGQLQHVLIIDTLRCAMQTPPPSTTHTTPTAAVGTMHIPTMHIHTRIHAAVSLEPLLALIRGADVVAALVHAIKTANKRAVKTAQHRTRVGDDDGNGGNGGEKGDEEGDGNGGRNGGGKGGGFRQRINIHMELEDSRVAMGFAPDVQFGVHVRSCSWVSADTSAQLQGVVVSFNTLPVVECRVVHARVGGWEQHRGGDAAAGMCFLLLWWWWWCGVCTL